MPNSIFVQFGLTHNLGILDKFVHELVGVGRNETPHGGFLQTIDVVPLDLGILVPFFSCGL
ncbi:hypothetical protein [Candidatus Methylacidiphilum infernorum]|uniref:Uncharacterized protein n=1 Tax=Methylacidiphilum infernorum (isolate V4) TaxID=481448 RepID=B3E0G9_METI4|nr:hypothetical protein [Candidatus Methylacidiphilum infernorum]ACD84398.1 Hypothetical protein Minf_2344 [Methylacidiphilum infernorum V4]